MSQNTLLVALLEYAGRGWPVIPLHGIREGRCTCERRVCDKPGKHPRIMTGPGHAKASTEERTIRMWWEQWPNANVGIVTGARSGLLVLDGDPRHGGNESLAELECVHGPLPTTLTVITGSGGLHFYFKHPGGRIKNRVGLLPGIDIRGDGGFVVAPPSVHISGVYRWRTWGVPEVQLAEPPTWLLELVRRRPRTVKPARPTVRSKALSWSRRKHYAEAAVRGEFDAVRSAPVGFRNDQLNRSAFSLGTLVGSGELDRCDVEGALMQAADESGYIADDGVDQTAATIRSGIEGGMRNPRSGSSGDEGGGVSAQQLVAESKAPHRRKSGNASRTRGDRKPPPLVERQEIIVRNELSTVCDEAVESLIAADTDIFQRTGMLVFVRRPPSERRYGFIAPEGVPTIVPVTAAWLREQLDLAAHYKFVVRDKKTGKAKVDPETGEQVKSRVLPPPWVGDTVLARASWPFRVLDGVIESPALRPDGSVVQAEGYDRSTGLLLEFSGVKFPEVPEHPTALDAGRALIRLVEVISDFPFVELTDQAGALAALLTMVARPAIGGPVPLFLFRSPTPGTGKSLLADVVVLIVTGREAPKLPPPDDAEETAKTTLAIALEGHRAVVIDNVAGAFGNAALASTLTATVLQGRLLGWSKSASAPQRAVYMATGNNVVLRGDLGRRVVIVDLDAKVEHPEDRQGFQHPALLDHVRRERPDLVVAALTFLRAYHVAGRPQHGGPAKGSFESWDRLVRSALIWGGMPDPLGSQERIREDADSDLDGLRGALSAWDDAFKEPVTAAEVLERARSDRELLAALAGLAGCPPDNLDSRRLGHALKRVRGRPVGGIRFETASSTRTGVRRWAVIGDRT